MATRFIPRVGRLEDRSVPVTFGNPWLDPTHVTLSFAPDGTQISGQGSTLTSVFDQLGPQSRLEILRAFQTWVVNANLNVGIVDDGGQDFSVGGAIQGDARFGDIRLGARPLGNDVLAITAPFNLFGTNSGNVVLNSAANLDIGGNGGYDLYTIYLQEAGHAFGLANSPDTSSVMYENYIGTRTGLSAADIASLQALYGVRTPDQYEGSSGNDTIASATPLDDVIEADLTTTSDVDCYSFDAPMAGAGMNVRVKLVAISLVTPRVELLDSAGNVIAATSTTDPLNNTLTLDLPQSASPDTYYVRVSSARDDVFGVGSYRLAIGSASRVDELLSPSQPQSSEQGSNDTLATATVLTALTTTIGPQTDYLARGSFGNANDIDYFRIHAPTNGNLPTESLVAAIWGLNGVSLAPRLSVYDADGNAVAAKVLTNDGGSFVIQVANAAADSDYFVRVSSDTGSKGNYDLAVDFRSQGINFDMGSFGPLSGSFDTTSANLSVAQSQTIHFVLAATTAQPSADMAVEFTIRDANGNIVFHLQADDGDARSAEVFLARGYYTVQVHIFSKSGGILAPLTYTLDAAGITDPIGVSGADTGGSPDGGGNPGPGPPPGPNGQTALWNGTDTAGSCEWF